jgi:hypothetical protein
MQVKTCAMLYEAYGGESMKKSSFFNGKNSSKWVARTWKVMREAVVPMPKN